MLCARTLLSRSLPLLLVLGSSAILRADEPVALYNGKDLAGWVQKGGKALYKAEGNEIVGQSIPKTGNSFLCTEKEYGDFVLELDYKLSPGLNSGVQVRSSCHDKAVEEKFGDKTIKIPAGRVHGYQIEMDPSARAWSGGIYDEGRRAWLKDLKDNEAGRKAAKPVGEWNHLKVECKGPSIKTWVNGVATAELVDEVDPRGFIALQVHGVGENDKPLEVRWKNITLTELK
jgi:hypothetical protein